MRGLTTSIFTLVAGCSFSAPAGNGHDAQIGKDDAPLLADAYVPDAGGCQALGPTCAGPVLRTCTTIGQLPTDTPCAWGCNSQGTAHCAVLQPSGGVLTPTDLTDATNLSDVNQMTTSFDINTDDGSIGNGFLRPPGTGIKSGIDYEQRGNVGVFRFKSINLNVALGFGSINVRGTRALAIAVIDGVDIAGQLDATADCSFNHTAVAGGYAGGDRGAAGSGSEMGGEKGSGADTTDASGGAGGAYAGKGGDAGDGKTVNGGNGGSTGGVAEISMLAGGGGGGGGGGGASGGIGGSGGGAIQIAANGTIRIEGGINVGGCGGQGNAGGGGAGGAGGTILLEAPIVNIAANSYLTANGGGGGGSDAIGSAANGQNGRASSSKAGGGGRGTQGGSGGQGGAGTTLDGSKGNSGNKVGGGGAGGVGRIRINTIDVMSAQISDRATLSPQYNTTACTTGLASVQ